MTERSEAKKRFPSFTQWRPESKRRCCRALGFMRPLTDPDALERWLADSEMPNVVFEYNPFANDRIASHSVWQSRATFEAWTRSAEFRAAHRDAGQNKPLYIDHPQFEGFAGGARPRSRPSRLGRTTSR